MKTGQPIWGNYQNARVSAVVTESGKIRLLNSGLEFGSLSMAAQEIVKYSVNGWTWWKTLGNDGKEHTLEEIRNNKLL